MRTMMVASTEAWDARHLESTHGGPRLAARTQSFPLSKSRFSSNDHLQHKLSMDKLQQPPLVTSSILLSLSEFVRVWECACKHTATCPSHSTQPTVSLADFCFSAVRTMAIPNSMLVLALCYASRLSSFLFVKGSPYPESLMGTCGHDIFISTVMIASKFLIDEVDKTLNARWAAVAGIPLKTVNANELRCLRTLDYRLHVSAEVHRSAWDMFEHDPMAQAWCVLMLQQSPQEVSPSCDYVNPPYSAAPSPTPDNIHMSYMDCCTAQQQHTQQQSQNLVVVPTHSFTSGCSVAATASILGTQAALHLSQPQQFTDYQQQQNMYYAMMNNTSPFGVQRTMSAQYPTPPLSSSVLSFHSIQQQQHQQPPLSAIPSFMSGSSSKDSFATIPFSGGSVGYNYLLQQQESLASYRSLDSLHNNRAYEVHPNMLVAEGPLLQLIRLGLLGTHAQLMA